MKLIDENELVFGIGPAGTGGIGQRAPGDRYNRPPVK